jgi:hypothetical protein
MLRAEQMGDLGRLLPRASTYNGCYDVTEIMRIVVPVNTNFLPAKEISPKIIRNLGTSSQNFAHIVAR